MTAASASKENPLQIPTSLSALGPVASHLLAAEIRRILQDGFGASSLLDGILICDLTVERSPTILRHHLILHSVKSSIL
jgi:hypothetical protein